MEQTPYRERMRPSGVCSMRGRSGLGPEANPAHSASDAPGRLLGRAEDRAKSTHYGCWFVITMQPLAANIPPTPRHTEISASGTWAGAVPRI